MDKKKVEMEDIYKDISINSHFRELIEISLHNNINDTIIQQLIQSHPKLILSVLDEKFGKLYEESVEIEFLATKYSIEYSGEKGQKLLRIVCADIVLNIESEDIYHFACQTAPNREMLMQMYELDTNIAISYRKNISKQRGNVELVFPNSAIIYITCASNIPNEEILNITLPNGTVWEYKIPVWKKNIIRYRR